VHLKSALIRGVTFGLIRGWLLYLHVHNT
jgi:hypothetical protein